MTLKLRFQRQGASPALEGGRKPGIIRLLQGFLLVSLLSYLSYVPSGRSVTLAELRVGEVAEKDIVVTRDLNVEDSAVTETARKKVLEKLIPLYYWESEKTTAALNQINDWLVFVKEIRSGFYNQNQTIRAISAEIEAKFSFRLSETDIRRLIMNNPFQKIDPAPLLQIVERVGNRGVLASILGTRKSQAGQIQIRGSGGENRIEDVSSLFDLQQVRETIGGYLAKLSRLDTDERELLLRVFMTFMPVTLSYAQDLNLEQENRVAETVLPVFVNFKKGKVILRRGDEITADQVRIVGLITSTEATEKKPMSPFFFLLLFWGLTFLLIARYLRLDGMANGEEDRSRFTRVVFITLIIAGLVYRIWIFLSTIVLPSILSSFLPQIAFEHRMIFLSLPLGFGAMIIGFLFNLPILMVFSLFHAVLAGVICDWNIHIILFALIGNLVVGVAIEYYQKLKRSTVLKAGFFWLVPVNVALVLLQSVTTADFNWLSLAVNLLLAFFSALLSTFLASFMIPLWEVGFKLVTDLKLVEITNLNLPIFREMLEKAPGTYHHSQMVASLAEAIAQEIGLSPLLLRAMALYHDIGKIDAPQLFTENHAVYENPHNQLSPRESTKAIISHVNAGLERAEQLKLPKKIRDAITRHHGTKVVRFFYEKQREQNGEEGTLVKGDSFRYVGPRPQDIEDAVIMLADQIEAAVKSLSAPSDEEIKRAIEEIIAKSIDDNQFDECRGMTFMALKSIANSFFNKLSSIYHQRIVYPGFEFSKGKNQS